MTNEPESTEPEAFPTAGEGSEPAAGDDPRDTDHPTGEQQADRNAEDEPAG